MNAPSEFLVQISPHISFHLKQVRGRFVQRKWLTQGAIWRWVIPSPSHIRPTALRDPFFETNSAPLYYFDGMQENTDETLWIGVLFDDHDPSKGKDVAQGDLFEIGIEVIATDVWKGRLEIEMPVNGKRVFERKRFHVVRTPRSEMAIFKLQTIPPIAPTSHHVCMTPLPLISCSHATRR